MRIKLQFSLLVAVLLLPVLIYAQGVTSGSIVGRVTNEKGEVLAGAIVSAIHTPSGSKYITATQKDGSFSIQGVRVGGPYTIVISFTGYETDTVKNARVVLGEELNLQEILRFKSTSLSAYTVSAHKNSIMTSSKNGSGNVVDRNQLNSLPTISRSLNDFTRLTPQAGGNGLLGKGGKSNNVSIDGAAFNNAFGLGTETASTPGANTNAQPISLDAIEQLSVDLSPYSVKQGGFTGAGVNAVTRSGDNEFRGSVYYFFRNQNLISKKVDKINIARTDFSEHTVGFRIGGPIIKDKLFFFGNYEEVKSTQPGAAYIAAGSGANGSNVSNVRAGTLDTLASFLKTTYNYDPGSYENYTIPIENKKFLIKLDWNINDKNKASLRYNQLTSSSSFGATSSLNAIGYSNNGFSRVNDVYSITGELNSILSNKSGNRFFASYTSLPDYRGYFGSLFPMVNIIDNGKTYTFGTNNAARSNRVDQKIVQLQDDFSYILNKHKLSAGASFQYFNFSNSFTINPQGTFIFSSLASFYNSASPSAYSLNYTVQPGRAVTYVNPKMSQSGVYVQDEFFIAQALKLTGGLRLDAISFIGEPTNNTAVEGMTFQDAGGQSEKFSTGTSPGTKILLSPRVGFNWALTQTHSVQLRGGTGIFTGNVPFTYISATFGTNGLNEGAIVANNTAAAAYPFNPTPAYYKPANGSTSNTYEVDLVSKNFKLPQTWRSTLGMDWRLPKDFVASIEAIYSKDLNAPFYQNVNLNSSNTTTATDGRLQYVSNRINPTVTGAYLLRNISMGRQYFITASLNKQFSRSWFATLSYTYGNAKDGFSFLSTTASGAFNAVPVAGNSNTPVLAYSQFDLRHRVVTSASYKINYLNDRMSTSFGLFFEAAQQGRASYTYGGTGDVNKDGVTGNDLIFVPKDLSQINLVASSTATVQQQWDALNTFIAGSKYLNSRRGKFAERNGVLFPWYYQADLRIAQDLSAFLPKNKIKNTLEFTIDILNVTNLLNKNWGVYKVMANANPVTALSASTFQVNPALLQQGEFVPDTNLSSAINPAASSRYRIQMGVRYSFN
jgi:hypothetical protein